MATGTGWPFGGPWIGDADACKNVQYKIYELKGGESFREKIEFIQPPYLRVVTNQIYEVHDNAVAEGRQVGGGTRKEPLLRKNPTPINIKDLVAPVAANKNLLALAIDLIQFEKPIALQALVAYGDSGEVVPLTDKVENGKLNWTAPPGNWKVYAVFQGWHGKMVERAGIGRQFAGTPFEAAAEEMLNRGFAFDYISDRQIENTVYNNGYLVTQGKSIYRTLVIPRCEYIPVTTLTKIISLAEQGATIIFYQGFPSSIPGWNDLEGKKRTFNDLKKTITTNQRDIGGMTETGIRAGKLLSGDNSQVLFTSAGIRREAMTDSGLGFVPEKDR